jgi:hypothetical protein
MGRERMQDLPEETILADARTNVAAGLTSIGAISEDLLRYGGDGASPRPRAAAGVSCAGCGRSRASGSFRPTTRT